LRRRARCRAATDQGNVDFVTVEDLIIPAGETEGMVGGVQGVPAEEAFETDGSQEQEFHLAAKDIAQDSIEVWVGGVKWQEVRTFYESTPTDAHYILTTDALDNTWITLGDGQYGLLPPAFCDLPLDQRLSGACEALAEPSALRLDPLLELGRFRYRESFQKGAAEQGEGTLHVTGLERLLAGQCVEFHLRGED